MVRISELRVSGFKSINNMIQLELGSLTVLAGANSAGKSSIMQPLLLIKQTIDSIFDPITFQFEGPNISLTSLDQVLNRNRVDHKFLVGFSTRNGKMERKLDLVYTKKNGNTMLERMVFDDGESHEFSVKMRSEEIYRNLPSKIRELLVGEEIVLSQNRCFFKFEIGWINEKLQLDFSPEADLVSVLSMMIHLPGLRSTPKRHYTRSSSKHPFRGTFENYVAGLLHEWEVKNTGKLEKVVEYLVYLDLTSGVSVRMIDESRIEVLVNRTKGGKDMVSIADVGIGVSQVLPVIVALVAAEKDQLVYIEQPEIHLHPMAQKRLSKIIVEVARRGVQVVIETHSSILLRGIQTEVARGTIGKNEVSLNWFCRNINGDTVLSKAKLHSDGTYGEWPIDFDETILESESEYLDASMR